MKSIRLVSTVLILVGGWAGWPVANAGAQEQPAAPQVEANLQQVIEQVLVGNSDAGLSNSLFIDVSKSLVAANCLGIDVTTPDAALRAQLGIEEGCGLVVTAVPAESLGAKAGLKVHDVLVQLGEQKAVDAERLKLQLDAADGQLLKLRLVRAGRPVDLEVKPKKLELARVRWTNAREHDVLLLSDVIQQAPRYLLGVHLSEIDDLLRSQLRLAAGEGLVVTEVIGGSAAEAAHVAAHDVLIVLDGKRLTTVAAINEQIQEIKEREIELRLLRGGKELSLNLAPRKQESPTPTAADLTVRMWDTDSCSRCHRDPHAGAHRALAARLRAANSVWTDGKYARVFLDHIHGARPPEQPVMIPHEQSVRQQLDNLKRKFDEVQQALGALEASLPKGEK